MTRQETTFTRTISRNQKLQAKTPEKEHFNMASQAECESCFQAKLLISLSFSGGMVNATALMLQPGPSPASGVRPPHLRSVPPISRLAPWFLHTSNTVFCKCTPLLVFGPSLCFLALPAAKSWRRAWLQLESFAKKSNSVAAL